jgi:hypothetical protein
MTAAGLALVAQAALAQSPDPTLPADGNPMRGESFVSLDANSDGVLSRSELTPIPEVQMRFETMDTDKNGTLSVFEFSSSATGATGGRRIPGATPTYQYGSSP